MTNRKLTTEGGTVWNLTNVKTTDDMRADGSDRTAAHFESMGWSGMAIGRKANGRVDYIVNFADRSLGARCNDAKIIAKA